MAVRGIILILVCLAVVPGAKAATVAAESLAAELEEARRLEDCQRLFSRYPQKREVYQCFFAVGRNENQLAEAARMLGDIVAADQENHTARFYAGFIKRDAPALQQAIDGFVAKGDWDSEVWGRMQYSTVLHKLGRAEDSRAQLDWALRVAQKAANPDWICTVRIRMGQRAYLEEDYAKALLRFRRLEQGDCPGRQQGFLAKTLSGLSASAYGLGKINQSLAYFRRELKLVRSLGRIGREAEILANIATLAPMVRPPLRFSQAERIQLGRESLAVAERAGDKRYVANAHVLLGTIPSLGAAERFRHFSIAMPILRRADYGLSVVEALIGMAETSLELHPEKQDAAFAYVNEAIDFARARNEWESVIMAWEMRAQLRWLTGPRDQAVADSLSALAAVESFRNQQNVEMVQARVFGRFIQMYRTASGYLLDPARGRVSAEDRDLAFRISERMRASVLLDLLRSPDRKQGVLPEWAAIQQRVAEVQKRLLNPKLAAQARKEALAELDALDVELLAANYGSGSRAFGDATGSASAPHLAELQQSLASDQALLAFQIEKVPDQTEQSSPRKNQWGGSWVFVLTRAEARAVPLTDCIDLEPSIRIFLGLIKRRDGSQRQAGALLYRKLMAPALTALPAAIRRLVIVPDHPLFGLPFSALLSRPDARPLTARYVLSLVPSAALWLQWQKSSRIDARAPVLALADPALPNFAKNAAHRSASLFRHGLQLGRLPHAREEARLMVKQLGGQSLLRLGAEANERFLKEVRLRDFSILHLAAHAVVDEQHPHRSAVVMSPGSDREDGLLQLPEIARLDLAGKVVILSTCSSAAGAQVEGEGVMSLARAFFSAGARAVVANLWPLRDDEAADLVSQFGAQLARGASLGEALQATKIYWIEKGAPADAWAGLQLQGDIDFVPFPAGTHSTPVTGLMLYFVLAALLLVAAAWWRHSLALATNDIRTVPPSPPAV